MNIKDTMNVLLSEREDARNKAASVRATAARIKAEYDGCGRDVVACILPNGDAAIRWETWRDGVKKLIAAPSLAMGALDHAEKSVIEDELSLY